MQQLTMPPTRHPAHVLHVSLLQPGAAPVSASFPVDPGRPYQQQIRNTIGPLPGARAQLLKVQIGETETQVSGIEVECDNDVMQARWFSFRWSAVVLITRGEEVIAREYRVPTRTVRVLPYLGRKVQDEYPDAKSFQVFSLSSLCEK
ncbi:MAG TPA: hypothetical protein VGE59_00615, partial [Patescibacteria group bacterium]